MTSRELTPPIAIERKPTSPNAWLTSGPGPEATWPLTIGGAYAAKRGQWYFPASISHEEIRAAAQTAAEPVPGRAATAASAATDDAAAGTEPDRSPVSPHEVFRQRALAAIKGTPMTYDEAALVVLDTAGQAKVQRVYDNRKKAYTARERYITKNPLCEAFLVTRAIGGGYEATIERPPRR